MLEIFARMEEPEFFGIVEWRSAVHIALAGESACPTYGARSRGIFAEKRRVSRRRIDNPPQVNNLPHT